MLVLLVVLWSELNWLWQFQGEHRESLYWGTYRPHVYLGIRARYFVPIANIFYLFEDFLFSFLILQRALCEMNYV